MHCHSLRMFRKAINFWIGDHVLLLSILFHDVVEDTDRDLETVGAFLGKDVYFLVEGMSSVDEKKKKRLELKPGMTIRVSQKIKEVNLKGEEKERIQYFEGMIIAKKHGNEAGATITIRKISNGIGVEKIFPINLPSITKIEVKKQAKVKRAKLGFLKRGYKKKLKEKKVDIIEVR